jgi:hypothetical protein
MVSRAICAFMFVVVLTNVNFGTTTTTPSSSAIVMAASRPSRRTSIPFEERLTCSVVEAVEATSLCRSSIYKLMKDGVIKYRNIGKRAVLDVRSVVALVRGPEAVAVIPSPVPPPRRKRRRRATTQHDGGPDAA